MSKPKSNKNSTNIVVKKKDKNVKKKTYVAKSFQQAYNKMLPSKEIRKDLDDLALFTSGTLADRTHYVYLDNIAQGTQLNQRLQNTVYVSYIHLRGSVQSNSTTKTKHLRQIIVRERNQGDFSAGSMSNLLKFLGSTTASPSGVQADGKATINRDNYITYFDRVYKVKPEAEGSTFFNEKIKIGKVIQYPQNNAGSSTPVHGHMIWIAFLYDADNATTATTVVFAGQLRMFFKDYRKISTK